MPWGSPLKSIQDPYSKRVSPLLDHARPYALNIEMVLFGGCKANPMASQLVFLLMGTRSLSPDPWPNECWGNYQNLEAPFKIKVSADFQVFPLCEWVGVHSNNKIILILNKHRNIIVKFLYY